MTLLQLEYFRVMSKVMQYSKAAEMLHTSQSNLSYAISELEKELGVPLFDKRGRGVVLSKYGLYFSHYVDESLDALLKGRESLSQIANTTETISLAFIDEVGYDFLPGLIRGFSQEYPSVRFLLAQNHNIVIVPALLEGAYDFAFSIRNENPMLQEIPIIEQEMVLFVPPDHRLAKRSSITLQDIGLDPVVQLANGTGIRRLADDMYKEAGFQPNVLCEVAECNAAAVYVSAGLGVCILPWTPLHTNYNAIAVPITYPRRNRSICLLYNKSHQMSFIARKFQEYVLSKFHNDFVMET